MEIQERCKRLQTELGVPVTEFCRRVNLSPSGYYRWRAGEITLSEQTVARIDEWLKKYGF